MKVLYTTKDGRMTFELEGKTQIDIWQQIADTQEVFENMNCTKFGEEDDDVKFVVRENSDSDKFYELHYAGTNPKLFGCKKAFGCHKTGGTLFPQRKNKSGEYLPDNGWMKWDKVKQEEV